MNEQDTGPSRVWRAFRIAFTTLAVAFLTTCAVAPVLAAECSLDTYVSKNVTMLRKSVPTIEIGVLRFSNPADVDAITTGLRKFGFQIPFGIEHHIFFVASTLPGKTFHAIFNAEKCPVGGLVIPVAPLAKMFQDLFPDRKLMFEKEFSRPA